MGDRHNNEGDHCKHDQLLEEVSELPRVIVRLPLVYEAIKGEELGGDV
jgi:hypothetical protein